MGNEIGSLESTDEAFFNTLCYTVQGGIKYILKGCHAKIMPNLALEQDEAAFDIRKSFPLKKASGMTLYFYDLTA